MPGQKGQSGGRRRGKFAPPQNANRVCPMPISPTLPTSPFATAARLAPWAALAAACWFPLAWPGDSPWINDEPILVSLALDANSEGRLANYGLSGSRGWRYGPLPVWCLQACLALTHNVIAVTALHAAGFAALLHFALASLARSCGWSPWGVAPLIVTPYWWIYSRQLWDNPWLIPLGAATLAAYASFLSQPRRTSLVTVLACLWAMTMVHLMAVSLVAAVLGHMMWSRAADLKRLAPTAAIAAALLALASAGYLKNAAEPTAWRDDGARRLATAASPLWGPRILTSYGLDYFLGYEWLDADESPRGALLLICNVASLAVVPLCWVGAALAAVRAARQWRRGQAATVSQCVLTVATGAWFTQLVVHAAFNVPGDPHYGNAVWIAYAVLAWSAVAAGWRYAIVRVGWWAHAALCAVGVTLMVTRLHETGGTRSFGFGPSLRQQWAAAEAIGQCHASVTVETNIEPWLLFRHAPETLVRLRGGRQVGPTDVRRCAVIYRDQQPDRAWLKTIVERDDH